MANTVSRLLSNGTYQALTMFDEVSLSSGSILFNGSSNYLTIPNNTFLQLGTSDFTVEFLAIIKNTGMRVFALGQYGTAGNFQMEVSSSTQFNIHINGSYTSYNTSKSFVDGNWHHFAICRKSGVVSTFLDGVSSGTATQSGAINNANTLYIAAAVQGSLGSYFSGYISNMRWVSGVALYTSNFIPSSGPLTPLTTPPANTVLLLTANPQNPFGDSSGINTVTPNNSPVFNTIGPFYYPGNTSLYLANTNNTPNIGSNTNIVSSITSSGVVMVTNGFDEVTNQQILIPGSLYFNGSNTTLTPSNSSIFGFSTNDYTVEFWMYPYTTPASNMYEGRGSGGTGNQVHLAFNGSNQVALGYAGSDSQIVTANTITTNTWYHVAATRQGTNVKLFINGSIQGTATDSTNLSAAAPLIGAYRTSGTTYNFNGLMTNIRVVNGTAMYTANFAPPTTSIVPTANTVLLLDAYTQQPFVDSSSYNLTFTNTGVTSSTSTPIVVNPLLSISNTGTMLVNGQFAEVNPALGSLQFNGTNGYLTIPYSTTNFDWYTSGVNYTIECWIYPTTYTGWTSSGLVGPTTVGNMNRSNINYWSFGIYNSSGQVAFYYYNGTNIAVTSSTNAPLNQWSHIAMTKTNSGITVFVNGIAGTTTAISGTPQSSATYPLQIGAYYNAYQTGNISNLRILKGTALYSGNFTPPTSPLTAIANTVLLLNTSYYQNPFSDSSSNNYTITINGGVTSNTINPFGL